MNKLTIPSILAATVLIAGIFAFMPVEKASTVHVTIGDKIDTLGTELSDAVDVINELDEVSSFRTEMVTDMDHHPGDKYTLDCSEPYTVLGIITNSMITSPETITGMFTATVGDDSNILDQDAVAITEGRQILIDKNIVVLADEDIVLTNEDVTEDSNADLIVGISLLTSIDATCTLMHTAAPTNGN